MVQDFNDNGIVGYEILYELGDICTAEQRFSALVKMVCLPSSEILASPVIRQASPCKFQITWESRLACPICNRDSDTDFHFGSCDGMKGVRNVTMSIKPGHQCVILPSKSDADSQFLASSFRTEPCSLTGDTQEHALFLFVVKVGLIAVSFLTGCLLVICFKFLKLRSDYRLLTPNDQVEISKL